MVFPWNDSAWFLGVPDPAKACPSTIVSLEFLKKSQLKFPGLPLHGGIWWWFYGDFVVMLWWFLWWFYDDHGGFTMVTKFWWRFDREFLLIHFKNLANAEKSVSFSSCSCTWNGAIGFPLCLTLSMVIWDAHPSRAWSLYSEKNRNLWNKSFHGKWLQLLHQFPPGSLKAAESSCHSSHIDSKPHSRAPRASGHPCLFNLTELGGQFFDPRWLGRFARGYLFCAFYQYFFLHPPCDFTPMMGSAHFIRMAVIQWQFQENLTL